MTHPWSWSWACATHGHRVSGFCPACQSLCKLISQAFVTQQPFCHGLGARVPTRETGVKRSEFCQCIGIMTQATRLSLHGPCAFLASDTSPLPSAGKDWTMDTDFEVAQVPVQSAYLSLLALDTLITFMGSVEKLTDFLVLDGGSVPEAARRCE